MKKANVIFENKKLEKTYNKYNDPMKKRLDKIIETLKINPALGKQISKKQIPKQYLKKGFNNAFVVRIDQSWRLIYSLVGCEIEILAIILDIMNHSDYDNKFGYN
jgi:Txe/YoeB family toxin of Txe-Axe toxin-antitoxin module